MKGKKKARESKLHCRKEAKNRTLLLKVSSGLRCPWQTILHGWEGGSLSSLAAGEHQSLEAAPCVCSCVAAHTVISQCKSTREALFIPITHKHTHVSPSLFKVQHKRVSVSPPAGTLLQSASERGRGQNQSLNSKVRV